MNSLIDNETYTVVILSEPSGNLRVIQSFWNLAEARKKQEEFDKKGRRTLIFKTI